MVVWGIAPHPPDGVPQGAGLRLECVLWRLMLHLGGVRFIQGEIVVLADYDGVLRFGLIQQVRPKVSR